MPPVVCLPRCVLRRLRLPSSCCPLLLGIHDYVIVIALPLTLVGATFFSGDAEGSLLVLSTCWSHSNVLLAVVSFISFFLYLPPCSPSLPRFCTLTLSLSYLPLLPILFLTLFYYLLLIRPLTRYFSLLHTHSLSAALSHFLSYPLYISPCYSLTPLPSDSLTSSLSYVFTLSLSNLSYYPILFPCYYLTLYLPV